MTKRGRWKRFSTSMRSAAAWCFEGAVSALRGDREAAWFAAELARAEMHDALAQLDMTSRGDR